MSGGISIHAVDVVSGKPANGMRVSLRRLEPGPVLIAEGYIAADGTFPGPHAAQAQSGLYEVILDFGQFYGAADPFLGEVPFRFRVVSPTEHIHLPIKFSPWGFALFRGA
jgi:5-hydroxyisourate hydrolase